MIAGSFPYACSRFFPHHGQYTMGNSEIKVMGEVVLGSSAFGSIERCCTTQRASPLSVWNEKTLNPRLPHSRKNVSKPKQQNRNGSSDPAVFDFFQLNPLPKRIRHLYLVASVPFV